MTSRGFFKNKRLYLTHLTPEFAMPAARDAMEAVNSNLARIGLSIFSLLSEFYSFDYNSTENLLLPAPSSIEATWFDDRTSHEQPFSIVASAA